MHYKGGSTIFYLFALFLGFVSCDDLDPMPFVHNTALDGKGQFHIYWTPSDDGFIMQMMVKQYSCNLVTVTKVV